MRVLENPMVRSGGALLQSSTDPLHLHTRLLGYAPSPLMEMPTLAQRRGIGRLLVKYDASRFGLPAFKMLGGSWATFRSLVAMPELVGAAT